MSHPLSIPTIYRTPSDPLLGDEGVPLIAYLQPSNPGTTTVGVESNYGTIGGGVPVDVNSIAKEEASSGFFSGVDFNALGANVSVGASIGSALGAAYSAWSQGKVLRDQYKTQAEIARINAQVNRMGRESALRQGEANIANITYHAGQIAARQRVAYAVNGVKGNVGSAAEVRASSQVMKKLDVLNAEETALASSWGYNQQAYNSLGKSGAFEAAAHNASFSGNSTAVSTLLGSIGEVGEKWYRYKSEGFI